MQDESIARFPTRIIRLAALWVCVGALFKLYSASPNDLPPIVRSFELFSFAPGPGMILRLAIAIEFVVVFTALLRPRWAWPWLAGQFAVFIGVLIVTIMEVQAAGLEPVSFTTAMFDPEASCGCFGSSVKVAPGYMLIVDGLLLLLLLASRPWRGTLGHWGPEWLPTGASCFALLIPWMFITTSGSPTSSKLKRPDSLPNAQLTSAAEDNGGALEIDTPEVVDNQDAGQEQEVDTPQEPAEEWWQALAVADLNFIELPLEDWDGEFIYDLLFRPFPADPDAGYAPFWSVLGLDEEIAIIPIDATVVIYRKSCEHCAAHIQELAANRQPDSQLVFMLLPESGEPEDLVQLDQVFPLGTEGATRIDLPAGADYVFTTPGEFQLEGGMVTNPREGIGRDEED